MKNRDSDHFYLFRYFIKMVAVPIFICGCAAQNAPYQETRVLMSAYITVKIADSDKPYAIRKAAAQKAFAEIKRIDDLLSRFKADSAVARINSAGTDEVLLDEDTFFVLEKAKYFHEVSSGAFDVTVLPLLELWGFHGGVGKPRLSYLDRRDIFVPPHEEAIIEAVKRIGSDKMVLDSSKRSVRFLAPGMKIDLGGIAKGYASDRAIEVLKACGVHNALVACAGDIRVMGKRIPDRRGILAPSKWSIGIQDPRKKGGILEQLKLEDLSVSTSGSYERFFEAGGRRYSHIIDPRTGMPVDNGLLSVTIIAKDSVTSDALTTAVFVLGKARGLELLKKFPSAQARIVNK